MKCLFQIIDCELYSFSFDLIDSRMYLLISNDKALIIDPCVNTDALQLLKDKNIIDVIVLLTHEHYDHISGVNWVRGNFNGKVIAIDQCAQNLSDPRRNASAYFDALLFFYSSETKISGENIQPYSCKADETFNDYKCFNWENHKIEIIHSPGHSDGSVCILIDDIFVFTGDSLIKGKQTITRLPGGSKKKYAEITLPFLKSLPIDSVIFPGHGEAGYIHEFSIE
ncbi:MBL fold metallo-hydrolase [Paenibacillus thiaminolyticus]|uniref:MBL fold metallo-hydrolase n=1 Tax=Paenibacillus thiaminolyticus TaxID=49283 RepID=A0AAP9DVY5_PANTH|nr:MBL fold metallo-hydrolase [Paenibacillus thiaminolyticus]MCY9534071.1 MBL fold metallo-hydrolase [Paenibacillus thiaminolyticus]MCY9600101.1 MBL fold metallo-hydrolase [Paenibacillus thiaminolyticus]MCY9608467.1 MBL fold metallo-hydrolase [Paenibacillus thiaminolyticus]MCY9615242.1 MBL fold metallo-hydrolase [Paenibacillus thiaminolyticus]MCY9620551.1 MBL fold metallo-hydrolase [Paenibacillus thiaminolyticus]